MKLACFAFNAPPLNDPEAFCSARFLSALARAGVDTTLLTVVHPAEVDAEACAELLDPALKVSRVALRDLPARNPRDVLRYRYLSWHAGHVATLVKQVRQHLSAQPDCVLLTRGAPAVSNVVGYYARDLAALWVAHFSDPFPGLQMYSGRTLHWQMTDAWWAKRILRSADLLTVTNRNAVRWFRAEHRAAAEAPFHVAYHVGAPPLNHASVPAAFDAGRAHFVHVGFWPRRRYLEEVLREFATAHAIDGSIALHHFGPLEPGVAKELAARQLPWLRLRPEPMPPRAASALLSSNTINVIVDQGDRLAFCPYLASKFAYAVASGRPLLAIGQADSEMGRLFAEHGAFYFADVTQPGRLRDALLAMAQTGFARLPVPGAALRKLFTPEDVAAKFIAAVAAVRKDGTPRQHRHSGL